MLNAKNREYFILAVQFLVIILFVVPVASLNAQTSGTDVGLEQTPQLPGPNERVSFSLSSFGVDLRRSEIFWYVDDVLERQGVGVDEFSFTTGPVGSVSRIDVIIRTAQGGRIEKTAVIQPTDVDILWEAHTYTPPFYLGKALPTSESLLVFTAIPHLVTSRGTRLDPGNLIFTWEQDGVPLGGASGLGKDSVVLRAKTVAPGRTTVTVTVSSFSNTLRAQKSVSIRTRNPEIIFYERHPLEGIKLEHALGEDFALQEDEVTLRAEPYFFSIDDIVSGDMKYDWTLNNKSIAGTSESGLELTLRQENNTDGSAKIELSIENLRRLLQLTEKTLLINFGGRSGFEPIQ